MIRELPKFKHENYLHAKRIPLDEAMALTTDEPDIFERYGMENECDGICGV